MTERTILRAMCLASVLALALALGCLLGAVRMMLLAEESHAQAEETFRRAEILRTEAKRYMAGGEVVIP